MNNSIEDIDKAIEKLQQAKRELQGDSQKEVVLIVDRSGSMLSIKDDMNGQIEALLKEQEKLNPNSLFSAYLFDQTVEVLCNGLLIKDRPDVRIEPRGSTALYDALGKALTDAKLRKTFKKMFIIVTDGGENASRNYNSSSIQKLTSEGKELGYEFIYCGANQDVWQVAQSLGIPQGTSLLYTATSKGVQTTQSLLRSRVTAYMTGEPVCDFSAQERELAVEK